MGKKQTQFDCIAGSQLRDTQGEMLSIEGADISELTRANDNHGKGFFNSIGTITESKKIFKAEDCENERHTYYWNKVKTPYIYAAGYLYDDEDHMNAKAAAAILRNIHKKDSPLKLKASVEGGVLARGIKDPTLLSRTKIHSIALTFSPANMATLVEPLNLQKSSPELGDDELIKSVIHLAQENVPSFRHIVRHGSAKRVHDNLNKISELMKQVKGNELGINIPTPKEILESAIETKITNNVSKIYDAISYARKDEMEKGIKSALAGVAAASMIASGSPAKADMPMSTKQSITHQDIIKPLKKSNPHLWALAHVETTGGKDLDHETITNNKSMHTGHTAGGPWGVMPNTSQYILSINSSLRKKYPEMAKMAKDKASVQKNHKKITEFLRNNPQGSYDFANVLYNRLNSVHKGDKDKIAHSWYHGIQGTRNALKKGKDISKHDYVSKFNNLLKYGNKRGAKHIIHDVVPSNHVNHSKTTLKKNNKDIESLRKSSKKELIKMYGSNPPSNAAEHVNWVKNTISNSNWQTWAVRNHAKNPEQFTDENKETIKHFTGSSHLNHISKVRFDSNHDIESGLNIFKGAENKYHDSIRNNLNTLRPRSSTSQMTNIDGPKNWYNLQRGEDEDEGRAMGHCGNSNNYENDRILSFRTSHNINKEKHHEPHLTFIENEGYLGEMKGRGNLKPTKKYHEAIVELLKHSNIKGIKNDGSGYLPENNFKFSDLSEKHQQEVLKTNPNFIDSFDNPKHHEQLVNDKSENIRMAIAEKNNLDPKRHEQLINDKNEDVRSVIARNSTLDPKHHEQLVNDKSRKVKMAIIGSGNLDPKYHEQLVNDKDEYIREVIARNSTLDPKHHEQLINDKSENVRKAIARNSTLDPKHHEQLINDKSENVRKAIARNPTLDPKHHEQLINDKSENVREVIAKKDNLDPKHHEQLINDKSEDIRYAIARNSTLDPKHHEQLINDKSEDIRYAIAEKDNLDPKHHEQLINDKSEYIRNVIARNSTLDPKYHGQLANDKSKSVRRAIAEKDNLDPKHHKQLVNDKSENVRKAIARKPTLDPKYHEQLINDEDGYVKASIAENPNLDPKYHEQLVNDEKGYIRSAIAENPNLDPKYHEQLINDENEDVRKAIAGNPNLGLKHQKQLVNDKSEYVREVIARNPTLDPKYHEQLANDEDGHVKASMTVFNSSYKKPLKKALMAGYGGAGTPTGRVHGAVIQAESLEDSEPKSKGFKYVTCDKCGDEQIYTKHQVKCRKCNGSWSLEKLFRYMP